MIDEFSFLWRIVISRLLRHREHCRRRNRKGKIWKIRKKEKGYYLDSHYNHDHLSNNSLCRGPDKDCACQQQTWIKEGFTGPYFYLLDNLFLMISGKKTISFSCVSSTNDLNRLQKAVPNSLSHCLPWLNSEKHKNWRFGERRGWLSCEWYESWLGAQQNQKTLHANCI